MNGELNQLNKSNIQKQDQNKIFPINWRYNRLLKIIGTIISISALVYLLISLLLLGYCALGACEGEGAMIGLLIAPVLLLLIMILIPLSFLHFIISLLRFRRLDKIDKLFLLISFLILACLIFYYRGSFSLFGMFLGQWV